MNGFIVAASDGFGELARLAGALADGGINITGCAGAVRSDGGALVVLTDDEAGTRQALDQAGYVWREVELVAVWLLDEPGALAEAARRLEAAVISVEALIPIQTLGGNVRIAFATNNPAGARVALGDEIETTARRKVDPRRKAAR